MSAAARLLQGNTAPGWDLRSLWLMMPLWQRAIVVAVIVILVLLLLRLLKGLR